MKKKTYISDMSDLMKEWDWEANAGLDPSKITCGSNKKVWWKCYLCGHKWQSTIYHRAQNGRHCPHCHHGIWLKNKNSLAQTIPQSLKDWHPLKNGNLTPYMFTKKSSYKIWWRCHICGTEWESPISEYRSCPKCRKMKFTRRKSLENEFPQLVKQWHPTKNGDLMPDTISCGSGKKVWWICQKCGYEWQATVTNRVWSPTKGCPCCENRVVVAGKNDLATTHLDLAKEWHPIKNDGLTPYMFKPYSNHKVWWLCPVCGYEYQATIGHRTYGYGCMKCGIEKSTEAKRKAVQMIDSKTGKVIKTFISVAEASRKTKILHGNIGMVCQGIRHKAGGYIWRYADEKENKKYQKPKAQLELDLKG